jgi:hypothetical protein
MTIDFCIFVGNAGDIGTFDNSMTNQVHLTNCVFEKDFPSSSIASFTNCRSNSVTASWTIASRLCPTYSVSASPLATQTPSQSASGRFPDSQDFGASAPVGRSGALSRARFGPSAAADGPFRASLHLIGSCSLKASAVAHSWIGLIGHSSAFLQTSALIPLSSLLETESVNWSVGLLRTFSLIPRVSRSSDGSLGSESGHSNGLIIGLSIGFVVVMICCAVALIIHRRNHHLSDRGGEGERSMLHLDIIDDEGFDGTDDTIAETSVDGVTFDTTTSVPVRITTDCTIDITGTLQT